MSLRRAREEVTGHTTDHALSMFIWRWNRKQTDEEKLIDKVDGKVDMNQLIPAWTSYKEAKNPMRPVLRAIKKMALKDSPLFNRRASASPQKR